jgi:hypothetical protein
VSPIGNNIDNHAYPPKQRSASAVVVCVIEIYNETVLDLLSPPASAGRPAKRRLLTAPGGNVVVEQAVEAMCRSLDEALDTVRAGLHCRAVAETASNVESSRSHTIVTARPLDSELAMTGAHLAFVDLAGSERSADVARRSGSAPLEGGDQVHVPWCVAEGEAGGGSGGSGGAGTAGRVRESQHINRSLLALSRVVGALA